MAIPTYKCPYCAKFISAETGFIGCINNEFLPFCSEAHYSMHINQLAVPRLNKYRALKQKLKARSA